MNRYVCIHGHFYQPPRENPWLEEIEMQNPAYPFHDWNERITAECYGPNSASRLLDKEGKIIDIVNNYSRISYNFGPTLLSWMEKHEPGVYEAIIRADKESCERFQDHGAALAQTYNHMIMPLANSRDKNTQIVWGIKDFEHRFGRSPEGMWLPETAVDLETLDILAREHIKFTILAPRQARRERKINKKGWNDVSGSRIDPKRPYLCRLPSGREISLFFYDGPIAQDLAFGEVLNNGETFAERLVGAFSHDQSPQLVHVATDGETYGHHHRYGDMALSYCLHHIKNKKLANMTIYGEFLEHFPPTHEVEIFENSSWSCVHGVERWRSNCGCNATNRANWNQEWRSPLRRAMDWLSDSLARIYEREISPLVRDPWSARDSYIEVLLDRKKLDSFLSANCIRELTQEEKVRLLKLLELQRHAMLMYTSCGWFFDDISGIETVQVIQYASRAMQLAREVCNEHLEGGYLNILGEAKSNVRGIGTGNEIYERSVRPASLDLVKVSAHYALSSLFEEYPEDTTIYAYRIKTKAYELSELGVQKLAIGKSHVQSQITMEEGEMSFAVLHMGDHNLYGGVRVFGGKKSYDTMASEIKDGFGRSDMAEVILLMSKHFNSHSYSLSDLFRDKRREVLDRILEPTIGDIKSSLMRIHEQNLPIMRAMSNMGIPFPPALRSPAEFVINSELMRLMREENPDLERVATLVNDANRWSLEVDFITLGFVTSQRIASFLEELLRNPGDMRLLKDLNTIFEIFQEWPLNLNLWKAQNTFFSIVGKFYVDTAGAKGNERIEEFRTLGDRMGVGVS